MGRITVRLTPRGGRDAIDGWTDESSAEQTLRVRVAAPPVDHAANVALIRLLARKLGVPKSAVRVMSGEQSRTKVIEVEGLSIDEIRELI